MSEYMNETMKIQSGYNVGTDVSVKNGGSGVACPGNNDANVIAIGDASENSNNGVIKIFKWTNADEQIGDAVEGENGEQKAQFI